MKKHDEGYVLVLVLVVVIVLCLVASAILSGALYNINAQHAQIEKMKEQYAAEGEIEKVIANLENMPDTKAALNIFEGTNVVCTESSLSNDEKVLTLTIEATEKSTKVICVLELTSTEEIIEKEVNGEKSYEVAKPSYKYISFKAESADSEEVPE